MEPGIKITQLRTKADLHEQIKDLAHEERRSWNRMTNELLVFAVDNWKAAGRDAHGAA